MTTVRERGLWLEDRGKGGLEVVTRRQRTLTPPPGSEKNKCENEKKNREQKYREHMFSVASEGSSRAGSEGTSLNLRG